MVQAFYGVGEHFSKIFIIFSDFNSADIFSDFNSADDFWFFWSVKRTYKYCFATFPGLKVDGKLPLVLNFFETLKCSRNKCNLCKSAHRVGVPFLSF